MLSLQPTHPEPTQTNGRYIMLRSALLLATIIALPSPLLADKIVNADGDSFIEVPATTADVVMPQQLAQIEQPATEATPANDEKPDYTAESFKATVIDALSIGAAQAAPAPAQNLPYDIRREFDGSYVGVPGDGTYGPE
jgi:hypothetical protein